jgi:hypothetical protein
MYIFTQYLGAGLAGLQGIFYGGTNCFHRRKVIYGLYPDDVEKGTHKLINRRVLIWLFS